MRRIMLCVLAFVSVASSAASATTYYLSPFGSDAYPGTSASQPWLSPNHSLLCGDQIIAAASTAYAYAQFTDNHFGFVSCGANNNVAWLRCAQFDACKINVGNAAVQTSGMEVNNPYWGVQGWEITNLTTAGDATGACFTTTSQAHHTIFINNVANQCGGAGLSCLADYCAIIGNISYLAAQFNTSCNSAIGAYKPAVYDTLPGTHMYFAGNFVWGTTNPVPSGGNCYDGNGFNSDHMADADCSNPFLGTVLFENNLAISNGGAGFRIEYANSDGSACSSNTTWPAQIVRHNTSWNNGGPHANNYAMYSQNGGQLVIQQASNVTYTANIGVTNIEFLYGDTIKEANGSFAYNSPFQCADCDSTDSVAGNWLYSSSNIPPLMTDASGVPTTTSSFSYGSNVVGTDPQLTNASVPGPPDCSGSGLANTVVCMAAVIQNFTPQTAGASSYGYQPPSSYPSFDKDFPEWLCHVANLPSGVVTFGCRAGSSVLGGIM